MNIVKYYPDNMPEEYSDIPKQYLKRLIVLQEEKDVLGRVAIYYNPSLGEGVFQLGAYKIIENFKASNLLLDNAVEEARKFGATELVGPMNGSTWENYRFVVNPNKDSFFLEPKQPAYYVKFWEAFGFKKSEEYYSAITEKMDFNAGEDKFHELSKKFALDGIKITKYDKSEKKEWLRKLARFNNKSFSQNDYFSIIEQSRFAKKYEKLFQSMDEEYVFIATKKKQVVGLLFGYPDYNNPMSKTIVVKTIAHLPCEKLHGLGWWMYMKFLAKAKAKGFQKVIHALIKKNNISLKRSEEFGGKVFKNYFLYKMDLS